MLLWFEWVIICNSFLLCFRIRQTSTLRNKFSVVNGGVLKSVLDPFLPLQTFFMDTLSFSFWLAFVDDFAMFSCLKYCLECALNSGFEGFSIRVFMLNLDTLKWLYHVLFFFLVIE